MDEEAMRSAVATQGPVSVLINANDLQHYVKGMGMRHVGTEKGRRERSGSGNTDKDAPIYFVKTFVHI